MNLEKLCGVVALFNWAVGGFIENWALAMFGFGMAIGALCVSIQRDKEKRKRK